jgi:pimeloyl-ACP methyl ester carboxylesterase
MPVVILMWLSGCATPRTPAAEEYGRGLIWMIPGIRGTPSMLADACRGLEDAGVQSAIEVYDWERGELFGTLSNLLDHEANLAHAAKLAESVTDYSRKHAGRPIDVVGYSGGGGLAVMLAEALPEDVRLRNVILVQAAVSPDYDLSSALARIDGKLINFHSALDWLILGLGTRAFGTMDRANVASAGNVGFNLEAAVPDEARRASVEQPAWTAAMLAKGHYGGHLGMLTYGWNKKYLAPYLIDGSPVAGRSR